MPSMIIKDSTPEKLYKLGEWVSRNTIKALPAGEVEVTLSRPNRSPEQNKKSWAMYTDFQQIEFNGRRWTKEDWKCFLESAFNKEMPAVGLCGEPVTLTKGTSKMSKKRFAEYVEFIYAEGTNRGVVWSDPSVELYKEYVKIEASKKA